MTLKKIQKPKYLKAENMKAYFFQTNNMDILSHILPNQRPQYENSFS